MVKCPACDKYMTDDADILARHFLDDTILARGKVFRANDKVIKQEYEGDPRGSTEAMDKAAVEVYYKVTGDARVPENVKSRYMELFNKRYGHLELGP